MACIIAPSPLELLQRLQQQGSVLGLGRGFMDPASWTIPWDRKARIRFLQEESCRVYRVLYRLRETTRPKPVISEVLDKPAEPEPEPEPRIYQVLDKPAYTVKCKMAC